MKRTASLLAISVIAISSILTYYLYSYRNQSPQNTIASGVPSERTIVGKQTCLPPRNTNGPVTLECAFGILSTDGNYYALDNSLIDNNIMSEIDGKERIEVTGLFVPIEAISTDHWAKYDIKGIIQTHTIKY